MKVLSQYINGNYQITLYDDGTKIKQTNDDFFEATFPDSIDLKITDYCDMGCPMCHENSTISGQHAAFDNPFLDNLHSGTELAIGGGNPLAHPRLILFLHKMKEQGIICNLTINEKHLQTNFELVQKLIDDKLIYGLGISVCKYDNSTIEFAQNNPNTVIHLICGIVTTDNLKKLYGKRLKILLLGYKNFGRGEKYYSDNIEKNIIELKKHTYLFAGFISVCFDNLSLSQLDIKSLVKESLWEERYMGDDGTSTMYIDLVEKKFSKSSTSILRYDLLDTTEEMIKIIHKEIV